ncbi:hypothetical protein J2X06_003019 [Lysobacter niastensis]|uniref:Peptidase M28 domain-containing protein n=2 Tax=Lysobacter niastensis TaxID=380629 RepID=A0ABU1WDW9_9GAMM|nr:hypothetical protein [Lysobacter niastensis]
MPCRPPFHGFVLAATLALTACAHAPSTSAAHNADAASPVAGGNASATSWLSDVQSMANATDNAGRRQAIEQRLDALGLPWHRRTFKSGEHQGQNLFAEVGDAADSPLLLIGAHSDRVAVGKGATDNASGSATVLALAERFKREPLRHHRVVVAFWDLEEVGLLGAKAYVADGHEKPVLYVNFDVFGWGDTLWMMAPDSDGALVADTAAAAAGNGLKLSAGQQYPPTDHLPFLKAGWPAVSYSLIGGDEIAPILAAYAGEKPKAPAKVMRVIHSDADVMVEIDAQQAIRGVDAVEDALRRWDAADPGARQAK